MTEMELRELAPQPTVAVRVRMPMAEFDMGLLFGRFLPLIGGSLGGAAPTGAPFGRYHAFGPDGVDVEIGIPVAEPPSGLPALVDVDLGKSGASSLPGGVAGVARYRGPYGGLSGVFDELHDWIHAQGHEEGPGPWESYIDDPEGKDPSEVRTEVIWPVG